MSRRLKGIAGLLVVLGLVGGYLLLERSGILALFMDEQKLQESIREWGWYGPIAVMGLMTLAIVMSPLPSAPIALASGMAYGHVWGTLYVVVGAEAGALIAFGIARLVGYETLRRWFGERLEKNRFFGSQRMMMGLVFTSRLLPFLSFDLVSYGAGLTPLRFWRFAVATLAGVIPMSFLLAHFGSNITGGETRQMMIAVLLLGTITLLPLVVRKLYTRRREDRGEHQ